MAVEGGTADHPASEFQRAIDGEEKANIMEKPVTVPSTELPRVDSIPVDPRVDGSQYLQIKDLRNHLQPQDSPFVVTNNAGAGFGDAHIQTST